MRVLFHAIMVMLAVSALAGCEDRDPYKRTDVWQPTGSNAANIAAMAANPHDLIAGRGVARKDSRGPEVAVEHIWQDKPPPLVPMGGGSSGGGGASGSGGGAGGG